MKSLTCIYMLDPYSIVWRRQIEVNVISNLRRNMLVHKTAPYACSDDSFESLAYSLTNSGTCLKIMNKYMVTFSSKRSVNLKTKQRENEKQSLIRLSWHSGLVLLKTEAFGRIKNVTDVKRKRKLKLNGKQFCISFYGYDRFLQTAQNPKRRWKSLRTKTILSHKPLTHKSSLICQSIKICNFLV